MDAIRQKLCALANTRAYTDLLSLPFIDEYEFFKSVLWSDVLCVCVGGGGIFSLLIHWEMKERMRFVRNCVL